MIHWIGDHAVEICSGIGICIVHSVRRTGREAEKLLSQADHAIYKAKRHGKSCFRFSDEAQWAQQAVCASSFSE